MDRNDLAFTSFRIANHYRSEIAGQIPSMPSAGAGQVMLSSFLPALILFVATRRSLSAFLVGFAEASLAFASTRRASVRVEDRHSETPRKRPVPGPFSAGGGTQRPIG